MRKKRFLIVFLQVFALTGFILMAMGSASSSPTAKNKQIKRLDRGACGHPDYVFMGLYDNQGACSQACHKAGFSASCLTGNNCYCK
jgi:hypothetical protein